MRSPQSARSLGWLYLATMLPSPLNLVYLPQHFIVPGDAAATARNISAEPQLYRLCSFAGMFNGVMFVVLGLSLYRLFQEVDRTQARLMVALVLVSAAIGLANLINELAPLVLLNGSAFAAFSPAQLEALAFGFLRLRSVGVAVDSALWGLWLLPFGILVIRSGFMPRLIGALLIMGCVGYVAQSVTALLFPAAASAVSTVTLALVAPGELSVILWLVARGRQVPLPA